MSKVILFDGICNLCNGAVSFVIEHDSNNYYVFASLESEVGQKYLKKFNLPLEDFDTFVLIDEDKFYIASTAALMVAKDLSGWVKYVYLFIYIPRFLRDSVYRLIAKNRYKLFGKKDICRMPTQREKNKFLN